MYGAGFAKNWPAGPDQTPLTAGLSMGVGEREAACMCVKARAVHLCMFAFELRSRGERSDLHLIAVRNSSTFKKTEKYGRFIKRNPQQLDFN